MLFILLTVSTFALADLKVPAVPNTPLGDEPIRSSTPSPSTSGAAVNIPVAPSMDYGRVLGALGVVIVLIFLLRWAARYVFPSVAGRSPSRLVEVLARSMLTPKQHVVLIRVGRRLIVVGDSGTQMTTLCEIADPDEVASLVGQLRDEKITAASGFGSLFGRFSRRFDASEEPDNPPLREAEEPATDTEASARSELDGLRDRVRQLAEQFK
jgi:flagellar biogenesis protein FliO